MITLEDEGKEIISDDVAIINVYEKGSGISTVSLLYLESLKSILGNHVKYCQIFEANDVQSPVQDYVSLIRIFGLPRWIAVPLSRLVILPKKLETLDEKYLLLMDPTLCYHHSTSKKKRIVIIHDLRPFTKYEKMLSEKIFYIFLKEKLLKCDFYICDSFTTKNSLVKLGVDVGKIEVIYPLIVSKLDNTHLEKSLKKLKRGVFTLTYVANDLPYKRIDFFLRIAKDYESKITNGIELKFKLVSKNLSRRNKKSIVKSNFKNLELIQWIDNINEIYEETDLLLFPSLYEGFGLPVIEAMSFGIPVIASDIDIMREVVLDSGILCHTDSLKDWKKAIESVLSRENYIKYSKSASLNAKRFTKDKFEKLVYRTLKKNIT